MAPAGSSWIERPRAATRARASASGKTPARQAATYSPMLGRSSPRPDPPGHPEPGQRVLDGEQRRLGEARLARDAAPPPRRRRPAGRAASRRSSPRWGREELGGTGRARSRKTLLVAVEPAAHVGVLRALPREQEGDRPLARRAPVAARAGAAQGGQRPPRGSRQTTARRCASWRAADLQRVGDVRQVGSGSPAREVRGEPSAAAASSAAGVLRREQQQLPGARRAGRRRRPAPPRAPTCALVPPTPKELTPARRGVSAVGLASHGRARR